MPSIRELVSFHRIERQIYARLLSLSTPVSTARNIVSLWIYLHFIGIDLLNYISDCHNDSVLSRFVSEAESILKCVRTNSRSQPEDSDAIPLTASLAAEQLNLRFFSFNRAAVARGIDYITNGIGTIIFDSDLSRRDLDRAYSNRSGSSPSDLRTLFVATSHGSGLRRKDVFEFFGRRWGDCVEDVEIEQAERGVETVYGRVVMKEEYFVDVLFENRQLLVMEIEGSPVFVRKFAAN